MSERTATLTLTKHQLGAIETALHDLHEAAKECDPEMVETGYGQATANSIGLLGMTVTRALDQLTYGCVDCAVNTKEIKEYYNVHDFVWAKSGLGAHDGMLCIGCLEKRIGRPLEPEDFTGAPINMMNNISERMRARLGNHNIEKEASCR
jgi:hypothetical protein